ncbi:MAG: hypothetical protein M1825_001756 [Sarcosagium campestre]|nr:MAG: hypothetical protein M1825_001756 [Sarcosagium campestre]
MPFKVPANPDLRPSFDPAAYTTPVPKGLSDETLKKTLLLSHNELFTLKTDMMTALNKARLMGAGSIHHLESDPIADQFWNKLVADRPSISNKNEFCKPELVGLMHLLARSGETRPGSSPALPASQAPAGVTGEKRLLADLGLVVEADSGEMSECRVTDVVHDVSCDKPRKSMTEDDLCFEKFTAIIEADFALDGNQPLTLSWIYKTPTAPRVMEINTARAWRLSLQRFLQNASDGHDIFYIIDIKVHRRIGTRPEQD